jgi:hypothetical protein
MRASARVVPAAKMVRAMSVPSGLVRRGWTRKSLDRQGMAGFVRNVRRFFYCLTYARARGAFFSSAWQWLIILLGYRKRADKPDNGVK